MTSPPVRARSERLGAVYAIVEAARRVVSKEEFIAPRIAADTGLSLEGVRWAFAHHLETSASDDHLAALVATTDEARAVTVILSANVFTAALRAVALARAAAPRVVVRPSRRDPAFATALVEAWGDPTLSLAPDLAVEDVGEGEIHIYGRDATIARVCAVARPAIRVRGHGAGMGVAILSGAADLATSGAALALDVVAFDQRGCLSPRVALVVGDAARAEAFGEALHAALGALGARIPRGRLDDDERAAARRFCDTLAYAGILLTGEGHVVAVAPQAAALVVPPPGRHVVVLSVQDVVAARAALAPVAHAIVAIGADDLDVARLVAPSHARLSLLGAMQRPPLDGPVDRRPH